MLLIYNESTKDGKKPNGFRNGEVFSDQKMYFDLKSSLTILDESSLTVVNETTNFLKNDRF